LTPLTEFFGKVFDGINMINGILCFRFFSVIPSLSRDQFRLPFSHSQVTLGNALVGGNFVDFRRWGQRRLPTELILRQAQDDGWVIRKFRGL
jgi:hypothetical protein